MLSDWALRNLGRWYKRVQGMPRPIAIEYLTERLTVFGLSTVGLLCWASLTHYPVHPPRFAIILPVVALLGTPLLFARFWGVWDLLAKWAAQATEQPPQQALGPDYRALSTVVEAVVGGQPARVRAMLGTMEFEHQSPWLPVYANYLCGWADLELGRAPDLALFDEAVSRLDKPALVTHAQVLRALLEAGSEDLAGRDWRGPLLNCRRQLGLHLSPWRALWPTRRIIVVYSFLLVALVLLYGW